MKFYIETYGCSANQAHSEMMVSSLVANGFEIAESPEKADVIVINTCVVKTPTENKIRERIKFFLRNHPHTKLVIAGCAADVGMFRDIAPGAFFLSSHRSKDIAKLFSGKKKHGGKRIRKNPLVNITEIASGCLGACAYCIVKLARGKLKSRKLTDITNEIENALKEGCKEIWLTSQDCGCYGLDIGTNLAELLESVVKIAGKFRVRVGMMNPSYAKRILSELIRAFESPKIYKFVHIPVQSGSDRILNKMRRGYTVKDFEKIVKTFRSHFPDLTLSTDIIVGFPGETEKDFEKTVKLIERIRPDVVNISKFGPRPGTEASCMKPLGGKAVKRRSKELSELTGKLALENNRRWVSKECEILVTEKGKRISQFIGRNESYKPVVIESKKNIMGKFLRVRISGFGSTYLRAAFIRNSA